MSLETYEAYAVLQTILISNLHFGFATFCCCRGARHQTLADSSRIWSCRQKGTPDCSPFRHA